MKKILLTTVLSVTTLIVGCTYLYTLYLSSGDKIQTKSVEKLNEESEAITDLMPDDPKTTDEQLSDDWAYPISRPGDRITKKPFGIYITPETSTVTPERFRGWHSGVDFEVFPEEENIDVKITAACTGTIVSKRWVSGYGGVFVQACTTPEDEEVTVLYGHLDINSIQRNTGDILVVGIPLGVLGAGYTEQTDQERKHLHFAVHKGSQLQYSGYAGTESQLESWIDPMGLIGL